MSNIANTPTWKKIAMVSDIPERGGRTLVTKTGEIALFRNEIGEIFALENRCPHKGGPLAEGFVSGRTVYCPLHNWQIDLACGHARAPDVGCVRTWPVRIDGEHIMIRLPE
jgi:nitrite reductase (NADH) small subunit